MSWRSKKTDPVVVDRSSPAPLSENEFRAWAAAQAVFVSSVIVGMEAERDAVATTIEDAGAHAVLFERLGSRDDDAQTAYLEGLRDSDVYIGILGARYGRPGPDRYSATHAEYLEAERLGLRVNVWATAGAMDGPQNDFLQAVQVFHTTGTYRNPEELGAGLGRRLRELAAQEGSPWCKAGRAVFRAASFSHTGTQVSVRAVVRDDEVLAALEQLRPAGFGRSGEVRVTCAGRSFPVRIDSVSVEAGPGRSRAVSLTATVTDGRDQPPFRDVAFNGRSPEDLTELAVRVNLFGEPNPLGTMGFFAEMENPFSVVISLGLSDEIASGVAEVLLVEELVGSGRAERLTTIRVGPKRHGKRRVEIGWLPRQRFTNVLPERRVVEGEAPA